VVTTAGGAIASGATTLKILSLVILLATGSALAATQGVELAKSARAAQDRGDLAAAIHLYTQAISAGDLSPENLAIVLNGRGIVYWRMGQLDQAIADYNKAIATEPNYVPAYDGRALAYRDKNLTEKAIADYDTALRLDPEDAFAYENRGRAELHLGRIEAAIEDLSMVVALEPDDPYSVLWLHLARAWARQDDAREYSRNAEKLDRTAWPRPIIDLFLGTKSAADVRAAAEAATDGNARRANLCEADFYVGAYHLLRGERDEAGRRFKAAAEGCLSYSVEGTAAKAQLKNLGQ
jgi:lipoprotein NlpI